MGGVAKTIDIAAVINDRKLSPFNYRLIALSWLITVFDGFDMMVISFTAPYIRDELGLSRVLLGNVFSAALFGMMLGGVFFAYLGDRFGRRRTIVYASYGFGLLTLATAGARSYEALLVLRFLAGFAIGGMLPLAWALNIEYVPARVRSSVVTVIMMGYSIGNSLSGPLTVWLAPHFGWQGVFLFGGVATLICATGLHLGLPESVRFLASKGLRPDLIASTLNRVDPGLGATASDRFIVSDEPQNVGNFRVGKLFTGDLRRVTPLLWLGYIASTLAVYFSANWGPIVYEDLHYSRNVAAYVSSFGGLVGAALGLSLMRFTDRHGPFAVAFFPLIAAPLLLLVGLAPVPRDLFLICAVTATSFLGGTHFGMHSIAGIFYPTAIRANGTGWASSVAKIGGIGGPILGAYVLASGLPVVRTFAILAVCPAIVAISVLGIGWVVRKRSAAASQLI